MKPDQYIKQYVDWLKNNSSVREVGQYCEITTPFLDNDNDAIQFYVKDENGQIYFTDDGYTLAGLEFSGMKITRTRRQQLTDILFQYGAELQGNEITAHCAIKDFAFKKHMFIHAMLHVSDMYMLNQSHVMSIFTDDIIDYFDSHKIFYTRDIQFAGKSGFPHHYDFLLQKSENKPERLCVAMNSVTRTNMTSVLFGWMDTQQARIKIGSDARLIVFINDIENPSESVLEGFQNYDATTIRWSERESKSSIDALSA